MVILLLVRPNFSDKIKTHAKHITEQEFKLLMHPKKLSQLET